MANGEPRADIEDLLDDEDEDVNLDFDEDEEDDEEYEDAEDEEDEEDEDEELLPRRPLRPLASRGGGTPPSLLGPRNHRTAAYGTTEGAREIIEGAPKDTKAYGWWRIEKVERDDSDSGNIMNRTVGWVMMLSAGTDPKSYLFNYIKTKVVPDTGPGEFMVRGCDVERQPLPDSEFFPFTFKGEPGTENGIPHSSEDFEMRRIKRKQEELKLKQMDLALEEDLRRVNDKWNEMAGNDEDFGPFLAEWIQHFEDEGEDMPDESVLKKITHARPTGGGARREVEALKDQMRQRDDREREKDLERKIEETNRQTREMIEKTQQSNNDQVRMILDTIKDAEPKDNPILQMLMQQNAEAEKQRQADKERYERERKEEKEKYEREQKEAEIRREEEKRRYEEERKEERRRYEEDRRRDEQLRREAAEREQVRQDRLDQIRREELKATQDQMARQAKADREAAQQQQQIMMSMMQMFKDDTGGSTKQVMSLIEKQSDLMTNVASNQLNSAMQNSQAFLEMAGTVRNFIGPNQSKEENQQSMVQTLIEQAGGVLQAYAGSQSSQLGALQGLAQQYGIGPEQLQEIIRTGQIPGLSPSAAQGLPVSGPPPSMPQAPPAVPQGNPNEPYPTTPPAAPTGGANNMSLILGNFLQHPLGSEVFTLITNCMKADAGEADCVHSVITNADAIPPLILTFLQYQSHADVTTALQAISAQAPQVVSADAAQTFAGAGEWWTEFQEGLREAVAYARGELEYEEETPAAPAPQPAPTPTADASATSATTADAGTTIVAEDPPAEATEESTDE
jgi:hypothetical protein